MTIENIPEWVPDAARRLVAVAHIDNPFLRRFLTDHRAKAVWETLRLTQPVDGGVKASGASGMVSCIDFDINKLPTDVDFACAAFCWILIETTGDTWEGKPIARIETNLNKIAKPYDDLVEGCAFLKRNEVFWSIPVPNEIADAADTIARYAASRSSLIKQQDKPFVLKRSSKGRGEDDAVRAWTIRIAHGMIAIWGKLSYNLLATIAEVLFELEHDPERRDTVKKWCQEITGK